MDFTDLTSLTQHFIALVMETPFAHDDGTPFSSLDTKIFLKHNSITSGWSLESDTEFGMNLKEFIFLFTLLLTTTDNLKIVTNIYKINDF